MIQIRLNGETQTLEAEQSLSDLIRSFRLSTPSYAVAVNRSIIPRSEQERILLKDGDEVELVHAVGGG